MRFQMIHPKQAGVAALMAALAAVILAGCGDTNTIDGKDVVSVPMPSPTPSATCYLLEVERVIDGSEQEGDGYACVSKEEWDRNHVDEEWVDKNGKKIK